MKTSYRNLSEFITELDKTGELLRIKAPVSSELEITEITDLMSKSPLGGKALLFENVENSEFPVLTNAFGSEKRINMALGCRSLEELAGRMQDIIEQSPPGSFMEKLSFLPKALSYSQFLPRTRNIKEPPCQEVVMTGDEVDLSTLPVLKCWPRDGGRFVTLPVVFSKGLHDNKRNVGMYRMQIHDRNTTGMHWHIHKDGSHNFNEYKEAGKKMEVAVAIGTDPVVTYAATAPMPRGIDEMLLAGFIRQKPVEFVKGVTVDIDVPAEAEFIIEGYIDPDELRNEGPFGDHTGYYSLEGDYPVLHVTAITHRRNPVYPATIVGRPPMEDCYLALATERLFLPMLRTLLPEVKNYRMPWEGVFHNIVIVAIEKEFPHHAAKVISGLWGSGQMSFAKALVLVDDEKYLHDNEALLRHILDVIEIPSDITISRGILDVLDHSAPQPLFGAKIGIDATGRIEGENRLRSEGMTPSLDENEILSALAGKDDGFKSVRKAANGCRYPLVLVNVDKTRGQASKHYKDVLLNMPELLGEGIFVFFDAAIDLEDDSLLLWKTFNNVDPARDIVMETPGILVDATKKGPADGHSRPWPDDIEMEEEIRERVRRRAAELGIENLF